MPKHDGTSWLWSQSLPRWYRNGGLCASESTLYGIRREPQALVRWKPSMTYVCEPLMGTSARKSDGSFLVSFPGLARRLAVYEEGLNLIEVFGERDDIFTLAVYRRQVHSTHGISLDTRFMLLADKRMLTAVEWEMLAVRMPEGSAIHARCKARAAVLRRSADSKI